MELDLPPGVLKTSSQSAAMGRWIDTEGSRFNNGRPQKVGGHVKMIQQKLDGIPRGLHSYIGPVGFPILGIGTHTKLYSVSLTSTPENITPIVRTVTKANVISTESGSKIVTVTDVGHDVLVGDTVIISGAAPVAGIDLNGPHLVEQRDSNEAYKIVALTAANATVAAGGGASVKLEYELPVGTANGAKSNGFGTGAYGEEAYGTPRTQNLLTLDPRLWSLDNYGNLLVGAYTNGSIYLYDDIADDRAQLLANAPNDVVYAFVTEERFIFALRQQMRVSWPDQDDPTDWTPTKTNTANTRRLSSGSKLMAGTSLGQGISLIWTDTSLYLMQYTGGEFIYESRVAGKNCGLVGPSAFCVVDGVSFWMSQIGFHTFSGYVQDVPRLTEIRSWVFDSLNFEHAIKSVCFYNAKYKEVWFVYPAGESTEPNKYVMVNLNDWSWANGSLSRVGHADPTDVKGSPIMASVDGYIYRHETGVNADGQALPARLQTGLLRVSQGSRNVDIFGFSPDFERLVGTMLLTVEARDRPQSTARDIDTVLFDGSSEMMDLRVEGRHIEFRLEQNEIDGDFRLGIPFIEEQVAGSRR